MQTQLSVCRLIPEVLPSASQLAAYIETPPAGIDRLIWQQACADNPNPDRILPVPIIGLGELLRRRNDQVAFAEQQMVSLRRWPNHD
ncbi:unnamed protein product [Protopolystoma xenopodis]|uniref:Nucleoporin Nup54 alpha-helical domain-containing protein n=1 Tax=Protopolystoma xenopodis TaxID=117903 RepID=A0A3S5CIL9_9PLAT|nr:unnamed protein product [Protopolystoma xenopodis]